MKISKEVLQNMYVYKGMTVVEIANKLKVGKTTILYYMDKHNLPRRSLSSALKGKSKSIEHRRKLSQARQGAKNPNFGKKGSHGYRCWYTCPNGETVSMRSRWEVWYAEHLRENNILFEYEPQTFILEDGRAFTPDFFLPARCEFVEVKGWLTPEHKDRIQRFRTEYPDKKLVIADRDYLESLGIDLRKKWIKDKPKFCCNFCGVDYHRSYPTQIYCSTTCRNRAVCAGIRVDVQKQKIKRKYNGNQSGEHNNSAKLDVDKVKLILKMKSEGKKIKDIIELTGATYGNIYNITHGLSWRHL